ncbi:MAG: lipid-A-disaccharide synthase [Candidatus Omnitrophica bacterium]|nr:lipid-A-disaccharide synthase [Candidatus Omnitrophota bacterium]
MAQINILIICGEASGDLNAGNLAKKILELKPDIKIWGVGGETLRAAGAEIVYDIKGLSVMGFFDVLRRLPRFFALKDALLKLAQERKPDLIILVDFSGFNLRIAKAINRSIPIAYYVSPQVWASRQGRIRSIKKFISKMIVLFKFEEEFYKSHGVDVSFAGHPLLDIAKPSMTKLELLANLGLTDKLTSISLLPGSRKGEIKYILPVMLRACRIILQKINAQFIIAKSPQVDWEVYNGIIKKCGIEVKVVEGKTYDCLNCADFSLVASGTATLEAALIGKPFVVIYKMNPLNYILYRPQVRLPYIGMVNIVAGKKIVPEFIQLRATPGNISREAIRLLTNPAELEKMKQNLSRIKDSLGEPGGSLRAAQIIINLLDKK